MSSSLQSRLFSVRFSSFLEHAQQFLLARARLHLQRSNPIRRLRLRLKLLSFDQVVIPVKLFAQVPNRTDQVAESRLLGRECRRGPYEQIHQASGLRLLHVCECLFQSSSVGTSV